MQAPGTGTRITSLDLRRVSAAFKKAASKAQALSLSRPGRRHRAFQAERHPPYSARPTLCRIGVRPSRSDGRTGLAMLTQVHVEAATRRWRVWLSLLFCLMLALAPSLADARAGSSFSGGGMRSAPSGMGSRGLRTFEDDGAAPITRSMQTPSPSPSFGAPS